MVGPLDRKLGRDLWRMKTQAFAIALVIAVGVPNCNHLARRCKRCSECISASLYAF